MDQKSFTSRLITFTFSSAESQKATTLKAVSGDDAGSVVRAWISITVICFSGKISNFFIDVQTRSDNCDHPHSNRIPSAWHRSFLYPFERLRKQLGLFWQPVRTGCGINKLPEVHESASDQVATGFSFVSDSLGLCFIVSGSIIEGKKAKNEDSLGTSKETNLHRAFHCIPLDTHKCSYRIV